MEEDWSAKQGRILTGGGRLNELYQPPHFPFCEDELPQYHKLNQTTWEAFRAWRSEGVGFGHIIAGAWTRPLFVGGWEHTDNAAGELVYNLQTPSIFLDMRIPKAGLAKLSHHKGFHTMSLEDLRAFARRHAFAGYTKTCAAGTLGSPSVPGPREYGVCAVGAGGVIVTETGDREGGRAAGIRGENSFVATRHHAIDWNFVGRLRPRPNKWRVEMGPSGDVWKEWGFAKDEHGQHVYMERWERLPGGRGDCLSLRRRPSASQPSLPDAFLVVCGDHFGVVVDRCPPSLAPGLPGAGRGQEVGEDGRNARGGSGDDRGCSRVCRAGQGEAAAGPGRGPSRGSGLTSQGSGKG
ncbi:unnamed protein product, partial [Discosporangium mesarthrocarpum]